MFKDTWTFKCCVLKKVYMSIGIKQLTNLTHKTAALVSNREITYFKYPFSKFTNFSPKVEELNFNSNPLFGSTTVCRIPNIGDLLYECQLRIVMFPVITGGFNFAWTKRLGLALLERVEINIVGQNYDAHTANWLDITYELTHSIDQEESFNELVGDVEVMTTYDSFNKPVYELFVPLAFWFNKYPSHALPIVLATDQSIEISVTFKQRHQVAIFEAGFNLSALNISSINLVATYILLDNFEKNLLIESPVQRFIVPTVEFYGTIRLRNRTNIPLGFSGYMLELIWILQMTKYLGGRFLFYSSERPWTPSVLRRAASKLLLESLVLDGTDPTDLPGEWLVILANSSFIINDLTIINSLGADIYLNIASIIVPFSATGTNLIQKINGVLNVSPLGVNIDGLTTDITVEDLSWAYSTIIDTRYTSRDPIVNLFNNYGLNIDGSGHIMESAILQLESERNFETREVLERLTPFRYHTRTPKVGINVWSWSVDPEDVQPSGGRPFITYSNNQILQLVLNSNIDPGDDIQIQLYGYDLMQIKCFYNNFAKLSLFEFF